MEGGTIMQDREWKDDSGNMNLQHQTVEVGYDAHEMPHNSPHSVAATESR